MKVGFDKGIKLEFHGAKVTSDGGLFAYRDPDDALGLFDSVSTVFSDLRTGRNIQHAMSTLLRQSIYSRLAGYEDVNDAERLSIDPVMRIITVKKEKGKQAASANTVGRFETEVLTHQDNLKNLVISTVMVVGKRFWNQLSRDARTTRTGNIFAVILHLQSPRFISIWRKTVICTLSGFQQMRCSMRRFDI